MAEASLNFNEEGLDTSSGLYDLYSRLYNGMVAASAVTPPDVTTNPPLTTDGEIDVASINTTLANYSTILMKNSAYLFASSIVATLNGGGSGEGGGGFNFVNRTGDSMDGKLNALYGFEAGAGNTSVLAITITESKDGESVVKHGVATVTGKLLVSEEIDGAGVIDAAGGFKINDNDVLSIANNKLVVAASDLATLFPGDVEISGALSIGDVQISDSGIQFDGKDFYHSGNANLSTVDWTMDDAKVYGDLTVNGASSLNGYVTANNGLSVSFQGEEYFATVRTSEPTGEEDAEGNDIMEHTDRLMLYQSIHAGSGVGLMYNDTYAIKFEKYEQTITGGIKFEHEEVSIGAANMVLNLGGMHDNGSSSSYISLKAGLRDVTGINTLVSKDGDGNFPNSLSAGCGNSAPKVMETYYTDASNMGVVFYRNISLGAKNGAKIVTNEDSNKVIASLPFTYVSDATPITVFDKVLLGIIESSSLFRDQSLSHGTTFQFDTSSEMFRFAKPVEASGFSIISSTYKTRLIENTLFLNDGIFIEGITDGMKFSGNANFTGSVSSPTFASGFAGYGWAVMQDALYGGYAATFDSLTIRKKMRVYEMEVQKISATNGSLWVSDSCSGDLVEELT